jgi:hypothetical protein
MKNKFTAFLFFLYISFPAFSQNQPIGYFIESGKASIVCVAYKPFGQPVYFVVRSSAPQSFFMSMNEVQKCLLTVKEKIDKVKPDISEITVYTADELVTTPFVGEYNQTRCKEWRNKKGMWTFVEFSFPYFEKNELKSYLHETNLMGCLAITDEVK